MNGRESARPLTEAQEGLWYAQRLDPANPIFNTGQYLDLRGPLDVAALSEAVDRACVEAEAMSLRFSDASEGPRQWVDTAVRPTLKVVDLSTIPDAHAAAIAAIRIDMNTPMDLFAGPPAFQSLYRLAPDRHLWATRIHHLATDGYGMVLLTERIAELYNATVGENAQAGAAFAPLAAVWDEDVAYREAPRRREDGGFWRETLAQMEDVVGIAPGRAVSGHTFHRSERVLGASARGALISLADQHRVSWPDALTALVAAYCRRHSGTAEIIVGAPYMGRMGTAAARVPAMVMNVLPVRLAPNEDAPLGDYLIDASKRLIRARRHGRYRSEQSRRDLGLLGGNRRLYGALVNVLPFDRPPHLHGLAVTTHVTGTGPVDDITFTFRGDAKDHLTLEVDANPNLYSAADTAAHGERLAVFLAAAAQARNLADVPTATPDETRRELEAFNATDHPVPETTLAALIEETMRRVPHAPALRFGDETLTYADLDRRSAALARFLRARGAGPERLVAVALPRSLELVIALIATIRAGAAYLPLDLEHPSARIATILNNARPVAVLAAEDLAGLYGERLIAPAAWPAGEGAAPASAPPTPDNAAYVIYTSGSTGDPKGVVVTHRAIVNRLLWMRDHYEFHAGDRILQKTPATFDVSVWEFFLPALAGALLVIAPPGAHRDPVALATLIRDEKITTLHFVPSMLAAFLEAPESAGLSIARVFCSGEELPADLRDHFHRIVTAELHNLYGPTEAAVDVSFWSAGPTDGSRPIPIGCPVWNTQLHVLDDRRRPVPPGAIGHLYLGGVQLAREYLGRPDLTAERFVPHPHKPGARLYMTGDLARRRDDGAIVFLGRSDHQVKIRGLRIELGEIEAVAAASGLARSFTVIARNGKLIAYVVPAEGYTGEALRNALSERLPAYMVPVAFVELEAMPLSANGKLDRKALPAPNFESMSDDAPVSATERIISALYAEILSLTRAPGRADDFFALGGDSLSAVKLTLRIREELGHDPGLAAVFEQPDVAGLSALIDTGVQDDGLGPLITLARGAPGLPALFVIHPAGGIAWGYRALAKSLSPQRTVHGIQAPALDPVVPAPASIEALAADYARRMTQAGPGPYHLCGWSVGGIVAQAVAVELERTGHKVGLVALLDAYPAECWRAEPEPTESAALRSLLSIAGYDPEQYPDLVTREQIVAFLRAGDSALGNLPGVALDGVIRVVLDNNRLVRMHYHSRYGGTMTHIRAGLDHAHRPQLTPRLWEPYAANVDYISVPFLHPQLTGAQASALIAPALSARMASDHPVPA